MTVTEIVSLNKRKSKVILDEGFTLVLFQGELRRYRIKEGQELSEEVYKEIIEEVLSKRAREQALRMLEMSDKTETQIRQKLKREFFPEEVVELVVTFLYEHSFLNDEKYARRYVEISGTRKSRRQIQYDLSQKGVDKQVISDLLDELPVEEEEQIRQYIRKKGVAPASLDRKERSKLLAALGRRGFSFEVVNRVLGDFLEDNC